MRIGASTENSTHDKDSLRVSRDPLNRGEPQSGVELGCGVWRVREKEELRVDSDGIVNEGMHRM